MNGNIIGREHATAGFQRTIGDGVRVRRVEGTAVLCGGLLKG